MKVSVLIITIAAQIAFSCNKQKVNTSAPKCIDNKIEDFTKSCCPSGAHADEYSFQGKTVYVLEPGNCGADMSSAVYDTDCNSLGFLGGFAGNTKINGEEFSNAKFNKTVWSN